MRYFTSISLLLTAIGLLAGCASLGPVAGTTSEYFQTVGAGFMIDREKHEAVYAVDLAVLRPLPAGAVIECRFENPAGGPPMITDIADYAGKQNLSINSAPMKSLANKSYLFEAIIYSDATKSKVISSHQQPIYSPMQY